MEIRELPHPKNPTSYIFFSFKENRLQQIESIVWLGSTMLASCHVFRHENLSSHLHNHGLFVI